MLNTYQFSAAKSISEGKALQGLMFKDGQRIGFSEYQKEAHKVAEVFNDTWLRTEYDTCVRGTIQGEQWRDMYADKDINPYWQYSGMMDEREREEHVELEGKIFQIGDVEGDAIYPPGSWNCRCTAEPCDDSYIKENSLGVSKGSDYLDKQDSKGKDFVDEMFRFNPGIQGPMPNNSSYAELLPSINKLTYEDYGLQSVEDIIYEPDFTTIEGINEYAGKRIGITRFPDQIKNIETYKESVLRLEELNNEFNAKKFRYFGWEKRAEVFASADNYQFNFTYYFNEPKQFNIDLVRAEKSCYHPRECDTIKSVIDHEFAHIITHNDLTPFMGESTEIYKEISKIKKAYSTEINKASKMFVKEFSKNWRTSEALSNSFYKWARDNDTKAFIEKVKEASNISEGTRSGMIKVLEEHEHNYISTYASKNIHEFTAESFTSVINSKEPSPFAKQVYEVINKNYKK